MPTASDDFEVICTCRDGDICLAYLMHKNLIYTCYKIATPDGWLDVPIHQDGTERSPWLYLEDIGFPTSEQKEWSDEFSAYAAMHVLGREGQDVCL